MHYELAVEAVIKELDERRAEGARQRELQGSRSGWRRWFGGSHGIPQKATFSGERSWR
jgi:hypothetical protein